MKVLFVGDIVGKPGRSALKAHLPVLVSKHGLELVIVNAENAAAGFGITEKVGDEIFASGAHISDAYVGPYTSIEGDVVITSAHSGEGLGPGKTYGEQDGEQQ